MTDLRRIRRSTRPPARRPLVALPLVAATGALLLMAAPLAPAAAAPLAPAAAAAQPAPAAASASPARAAAPLAHTVATTPHGTLALTVGGPAARQLRAQGVTIAASAPATARGSAAAPRLTLPVASGRVTTSASLTLRGSVVLRHRGPKTTRAVRLSGWTATFGGATTRVSARVGATRVPLLTIANATHLKLVGTAGSVRLTSSGATLTRAGATALRRALGLTRLSSGRLARATVTAAVTPQKSTTTGGSGGGGGTSGGSGGSGTTPPTTTTPPIVSAPITNEPPVLARPATAVPITGATVTWHPRESFVQYINAGSGTSTSDGATSDPPSVAPGSDARLVYGFHFPFTSGWWDPVSGTAGVYFGGTVTFSYPAHGIDLDVKNPELELTGASSRAIMRFSGSEGTDLGDKRGVLVNLDPSRAASSTVTGATHDLEQIPGTIPQGTADSVFAGFYLPGDAFGWFSVTFTIGA